MKKIREVKGITLVVLVITIVILILIAGVTINTLINNGMLNQTNRAISENKKQTAIEKMNLKITNLQMTSYIEKQELPTLQYLADKLCEDDEMEYVLLESQSTASLDKIIIGDSTSIFTKLKDYPYEFEINSSLQLASIDGVKTNVQIPDGYIKPSGIKEITQNGEYDISKYEKVNVNVVTDKKYTEEEYQQYGTNQYNSGYTNGMAIGGKGTSWNSGTETIEGSSTVNIDIGFTPSYIVFTRRSDDCHITYSSNINTSKQYIRGIEYDLNRGDTGIISIGEIVEFYTVAPTGMNTVWDWIAIK